MGINSYIDMVAMGRHLVVKEPELEHIEELAETMRHADKKEISRATGETPLAILDKAVSSSCYARVAIVDGVVASMWGLVKYPDNPQAGAPWCFSTDLLDGYKRVAANLSRFYLNEMKQLVSFMCVEVDAEHFTAVRWLSWLGFDLELVDVNGYMFHRATIEEVELCAHQ